jgi:hypothetical protein
MSKKKPYKDNKPNHHDLFSFNFAPNIHVQINHQLEGGSQEVLSDFEYNFRLSLKKTLDACANRSADPMDRIEVAARMSRKLGRDITKTHLDQWTAMSTVQRRIHADSLKALCEVTGDFRPLYMMVESCGFKVLHPEEAMCAEYGSRMMMKKYLEGELKDIAASVDETRLMMHLMDRYKNGGRPS